MRFREDTHPLTSTQTSIDDSILSNENNTFLEPPSPQMNNSQNNTMKNRQRHDSVRKKNQVLLKINT